VKELESVVVVEIGTVEANGARSSGSCGARDDVVETVVAVDLVVGGVEKTEHVVEGYGSVAVGAQ
jgi:hypothetical protein